MRFGEKFQTTPCQSTARGRSFSVLLLAKGTGVTAEDVHNAWVAWILPRDQTHESLVPFAQLSAQTQSEDLPFVEAIRRVATRRSRLGDEGVNGELPPAPPP
jgi:hypothetical protein